MSALANDNFHDDDAGKNPDQAWRYYGQDNRLVPPFLLGY
jgi:hypothetical protein